MLNIVVLLAVMREDKKSLMMKCGSLIKRQVRIGKEEERKYPANSIDDSRSIDR